jgi:hypothetical protein
MIRLYTKSAQGPVEFPAGESFTYAKDQLVIFDKYGSALAPVPLKEVRTATHIRKNGWPGMHVEFGGERVIVLPEERERMPLQTDVMATVEQRPNSTLGKLMHKAMERKNQMPQNPCKHGLDVRFCEYCVKKSMAPASFAMPEPGEVMGSAG